MTMIALAILFFSVCFVVCCVLVRMREKLLDANVLFSFFPYWTSLHVVR
jgi:hypothetical protein